MARKVHTFKYTSKELDTILDKAAGKPFVVWHHESAGVYRFFPDEEKRDAWIEAYNNDALTPEIDAYQFADPITAPAPYTINITVANDNIPILYGTTGNTVNFTFETLDGNGSSISESVDVYYTFRSPAGTKSAAAVYNAGTEVAFNIDKYISLGKNTVSIMVKGRATGTTKTVVATYTVVNLSLTSTFPISRSLEANTPFDVTYHIEGDGDKSVEFYIDGTLNSNAVVSSLEPNVTKVQRISGLAAGKHTLQILARMQIGSYQFRSNLLYYEFIVKGLDLTTTVISETFGASQNVFIGSTPGLYGEQYVIKEINWAYYSSDYTQAHATIQWRLYTEAGVETPIATRNADIVEAENDTPPEPLRFMPTESGAYHLQALVDGVIIADYTISIIQNTAGILESTNGLTMKLAGLGRDNNEPAETLSSWSNRGFSTTFANQPWNGNSGWIDNALVLNGGATAQIDNKPFAVEINPAARNGCVFEIDFETFNVNNEDAELLRIGGIGTASIVITSNKAILRSRNGNTIESRFKSDERIKICFVVYPNTGTDYARKVFVYNNGVMSGVINYEIADNFNIGSLEDTESQIGMINLGNADGEAGIKVYYIRTYSNFITMYEELNNYFIDSGENLNYLVADNDIYATGTRIIDVDKLEGTITTVKFTGPLNELINQGSGKHKATCAMEVVSPTNSNINLYCDLAEVGNAGQSTLDKPVPSFHVKLDKNGNICYNRDGVPYSKNRWAFREGNIPEKKFRLQANYMDSSGCHNGAFFRMFNEVAPKVRVNGNAVLRIPSEKYATDLYPSAMEDIHGEDPSGNGWKFPYRINICPDSIPCIVVWRPDENSSYRFLGQYVIMEEKKANYANGMHSIYSGLDASGNPDPFGFKSEKAGTKLWDNEGCHQMEFLRSTGDLELFLNDSQWENERVNSFELIYPDEDDLTPSEIEAEWAKFYNDVVHPIVSSKNNQSAFEALLYGSNPKLDRWHFAAYYCLAMRNACTDSMVRNMELVTYDGNVWLPKWWDVDMQCGLQQTGECNIVPTSTRETLAPGSTTAFAFSGRMYIDGVLKSSWLWDALEASDQFMQDVAAMDKALYQAGWTYTQMTKMQDENYIDTWSNALYNESSVAKYLNYNDLPSLQGDRTPHRHWFLRTSYDFFDALNVCGEYTSKLISIRTHSISPDKYIIFKAASTSYFGWGYTNNIIQSGIRIEKGNTGTLTIDRTLGNNDPLHIFAANKIAEIDLSSIAENIAGADIDFGGTYDSLLGSQLRKLVLGVSKTKMHNGTFNTFTSATEIQGASTLSRMEYLDIQGFQYFAAVDMTAMHSLKTFLAAGAGLRAFNPASGSDFDVVELPTSVVSMEMSGCNLTDENDNCVIDWYETIYEDDVPVDIQASTVPSTMTAIIFTGMGSDIGARKLIFDWINAVYDDFGDEGLAQLQITCNNVNWSGVSIDDVLLLSKIPTATRKITGRIVCSGTMTSADIVAIQNAFGEHVFEYSAGNSLIIDATSGFILALPDEIQSGTTTTVKAVSFPISDGGANINYSLGYYVGVNYVAVAPVNGIYTYMGASLRRDAQTGNAILEIEETQDPDYIIGIHGDNGINGASMPVTVKKRIYPSSLDFVVTHTPGKDVSYDPDNEAYYVTSDNVVIDIDVETDPEEITGTVVSETWSVSNSIISNYGIEAQDNNHLRLNVLVAGATLTTGTITHTKTYVDNYSVTKTVTFRFQSPVYSVTTMVNSALQAALYAGGIATHDPNYTYNYEAWTLTDLASIGILDTESTLTHLGELNEFINLDMDVLDLSNCPNAGSVPNAITLEDGTTDYVDILPRASQTIAFDFEEVHIEGTQYKGVNLKEGNTLLSVSYSDYTENINLVNQSVLELVNVPIACLNTLETLVIENCNELEEITWI